MGHFGEVNSMSRVDVATILERARRREKRVAELSAVPNQEEEPQPSRTAFVKLGSAAVQIW